MAFREATGGQMKHRITAVFAAFVLVLAGANAFAQVQVSERKEIAIFALGYRGWNIPLETLGTIDVDIQRVFLDLGRFTIFGMEKRFAAKDVEEFIKVLRQTKEANFVLPEKYQFGEEFLTEADFNKLTGAFIIAVPVVTSFNSQLVDQDWETDIKTNVTFIDVASGTMIGLADVETSGSSRETQYKSIQSAIDGIPMQLQFEIRSISAFQNVTRVLAVSGGTVDMQLGKDMGVKVGDEYAVIESDTLEGFLDEREVGLVLINEVGTTRSRATVLYSKVPLEKDVQLREIPRLGVDFAPYAHAYWFLSHPADTEAGFLLGARAEATRGFYNLRPYAAVQVLFDTDLWLPLNVMIGGQYSLFMRRLEAGGRLGVAGGSNFILRLIEEQFSEDDDPWFSHYGVSAGGYLSFLVTRDLKIFAEVQADYMFGIANAVGGPFSSYGGYQVGIGVTFKQ
jgi:hypothetical protein